MNPCETHPESSIKQEAERLGLAKYVQYLETRQIIRELRASGIKELLRVPRAYFFKVHLDLDSESKFDKFCAFVSVLGFITASIFGLAVFILGFVGILAHLGVLSLFEEAHLYCGFISLGGPCVIAVMATILFSVKFDLPDSTKLCDWGDDLPGDIFRKLKFAQFSELNVLHSNKKRMLVGKVDSHVFEIARWKDNKKRG